MIMAAPQEIYPEAEPEPDHGSTAGSRCRKKPLHSLRRIQNLLRRRLRAGIQNIQKEIMQKNEEVKKEYHYPPLKLLKRGDGKHREISDEHLCKTAKEITGYAAQFRCQCHSDECKLWSDGYPL